MRCAAAAAVMLLLMSRAPLESFFLSLRRCHAVTLWLCHAVAVAVAVVYQLLQLRMRGFVAVAVTLWL